jgi:hypothetical protein
MLFMVSALCAFAIFALKKLRDCNFLLLEGPHLGPEVE